MAQLKAKIDDIDTLVNAIKTNKEKINTSVKSISQPSQCKGIMVSTYVDKIKEISSLLDKYKQLLDKDTFDFINAKQKIEQMDKDMQHLYNDN